MPTPFHLSLHCIGVSVFSGWTGRGGCVVLNREAHHCTLALDTVQEEVKGAHPLLGRP